MTDQENQDLPEEDQVDATEAAQAETDNEPVNDAGGELEAAQAEITKLKDAYLRAKAEEDNVRRDADDSVKSIHEGVEITLKQLQSGFAKYSLTEIAPEVGDKLDPNLHQAMSMVESGDVESGCILNVIQAGFQLHDRLIRPAMVVVAK